MSFVPTQEQQQVLAHDHSRHARVLAGPGTGKSATIVQYLHKLHAHEASPRTRLLTFTRAATAELAERVREGIGLKPSTVHSFAISILLRNPGSGNFPEPLRIADDWETAEIVNPSLKRILKVEIKEVRQHIKEMAAAWESLDDTPGSEFSETQTRRFLAAWNDNRRVWGYTLLSELPYRLREALADHDDLQGCEVDLLVVDEYQDLNACDLDVIRTMARKHGTSVLAVGDDDQSIYRFRQAAPQGIRRFPADYADCADFTLSRSLRCGRRIIAWANHVIQFNQDRPQDRALLTAAEGNPEGVAALLSFANQSQEARGVAKLAEGLIRNQHLAPSDVLILLRADHQENFSRPIKQHLDALGVPCTDIDWVKRLLANDDNRRTLALLRLLVNTEDSLAWATLLSTTDGIGEGLIGSIYDQANDQNITFASAFLAADLGKGRSPRLATALRGLVQDWRARTILPPVVMNGWATWIEQQILPDGFGFDEECRGLVGEVAHLVEDDIDLNRFLSQITPVGKDIAAARSDGVRIMSMASSKGLTVRGTIIASCEEGIIPHESADSNEEARLLYVAMTRAKEFLYCTWARSRYGPTARVGREQVGGKRNKCRFFEHGPVSSTSGDVLLD